MALVAEVTRARCATLGAHSHDEELTAVRAEKRAADALVSELALLAQHCMLEEIGDYLTCHHSRAGRCVMRCWLTLSEIAETALPGQPKGRRGLAEKARREGWAARSGLVRISGGAGGGMKNSINILPSEVRVAWIARHALAPKAALALHLYEGYAHGARVQSDARLWVLNAFAASSYALRHARMDRGRLCRAAGRGACA